jgi:hypothetical protein
MAENVQRTPCACGHALRHWLGRTPLPLRARCKRRGKPCRAAAMLNSVGAKFTEARVQGRERRRGWSAAGEHRSASRSALSAKAGRGPVSTGCRDAAGNRRGATVRIVRTVRRWAERQFRQWLFGARLTDGRRRCGRFQERQRLNRPRQIVENQRWCR